MVYPSASNVSFRLFSDCSDPAGFCTDFQAREKKSLDCCAPIKGFSCLRRCGSASISVRGEYWMESDQCHFIWIINDDVDDVDDDDYHCGIHLALRLRRPWAYYSLLATTATTYKFRTRFTLVRLVRQNHLPPPSFSLLMLLPHLPSPPLLLHLHDYGTKISFRNANIPSSPSPGSTFLVYVLEN